MDGVLAFTEGFYTNRRLAYLAEHGIVFDEVPDWTGSNDNEVWESSVPDPERRERLRAGYKVYDLGTNVSPDAFIAKVKEVHADILAMSNPMLQTTKYLKEAAEKLEAEGLRDKVKITIGGASTTAATKDQVLADAWSKDGNECIQVCGRLREELRA